MEESEAALILPSKQTIIKIMKDKGVPPQVIEHELAVSRKAVKIAYNVINAEVNVNLVRIGALIHDIGRSVTHKFDHGIVGAEIIRELDFCEPLARIAECHLLAGLDSEDAKSIGLPEKDFRPSTIEEKIVCLADKYLSGTHKVTIESRFQSWELRWGESNFLTAQKKRAQELEIEILHLMYD